MTLFFLNTISFITPILGAVASLSISVLFIVYVLLVVFPALKDREQLNSLLQPKGLLLNLSLFLAYCSFSSLYSLSLKNSLVESLRVITIIVFGFILLLSALRIHLHSSKLFLLGYCIALVICLIEFITNGIVTTLANFYLLNKTISFQPFYLNRGMCFLAVVVWVAIIPLLQRNFTLKAFSLLILTTLVIFMSDSESAKLGIFVGVITYILASKLYNKFAFLCQISIVIAYIFVPIIIYLLIYNPKLESLIKILPWTFEHRMYIWQNVLELILLKPISGYGFNAARIISNLNLTSLTLENNNVISLLPLHPHNGIIQILLELGIIGLVLNLLIWVNIIQKISSTSLISREYKPCIYAIITSYLTISQSSFNIWIDWWLCLVFLVSFHFITLINVKKNQCNFFIKV